MAEIPRSITPGNRTWVELDTIAGKCGFKEAKSDFYQYAADLVVDKIKKKHFRDNWILFLGVLLVVSIVLQLLQLLWNT